MDAKDILPLLPDDQYDPSEIVLIGTHMAPSPEPKDSGTFTEGTLTDADRRALAKGEMNVRSDFATLLTLLADPIVSTPSKGKKTATCPTIALVYAYGYEGHTYRLPKPRIMIVQGPGKAYVATQEQDPSPSLTGKLYMWRLSKHHQTISIEVESGTLEKLVLEANQPGKGTINAYSAHMQMAHRGGKLT